MRIHTTRLTDWKLVKELAMATCWKTDEVTNEPSSSWKRKILLARHSPIEGLIFKVEMLEIPYWVSVHLVRHKFGISHYVSSQRDDRHDNPVPREELPQGALVNHTMLINAQALIAVSKKRLCSLASPETREVWKAVRKSIYDIGEHELFDMMRPECLWCGNKCPEMRGCGMCEPMN